MPAEPIERFLREAAPLKSLTAFSAGYGSQPQFNESGKCISPTYSIPRRLRQLVNVFVEKQTAAGTGPDAGCFQFCRRAEAQRRKGNLIGGADADFLIYGKGNKIESVVTRGQIAVREKEHLVRGRFEI